VDYQAWLQSVDQALKSGGSKLRVKRIDPDCLQAGFDAGESPVTFAKRTDLDLIKPGQKPAYKPRFQYWLLSLLLFIPLALHYRNLREIQVEKAAMELLQTGIRWPRRLPIVTREGTFFPPEAEEAKTAAKEKILDMLLNPKAAEFEEIEAVSMVGAGQYQIEGEVSSTNQAGALATASFKILMAWPYEVRRDMSQPRANWIKRKGEWKIIQKDLERTAESTIWREEDEFRQPRAAAKYKSSSSPRQRPGALLYTEDREQGNIRR